MKRARIEVTIKPWRGPDGESLYYWRLLGVNGKIICHSETFVSHTNALRAAKRAKALFQTAEVVTK